MSKQYKADLVILGITVIWGASFTLMKNVLEYMPVFAYLSLSFLTASFTLLILFKKELRAIDRKTVLDGSLIGLMVFGGMALQVAGLQYTTASNSAFITGLNVILVPIISATLLKKKPPISAVIGVALAGLGLFSLSGGIKLNFNIGDLLTLICAFCFAFQIILIDKSIKGNNSKPLALVQVCSATLLYVIIWLFFDKQPIEINITVIITILFTGALCTAIAYAAQTMAQQYTTPTRTALILTGEPVFGAIFAVTIPNSQGYTEVLKSYTIMGCILILLGMLITELVPKIKNKN